MISSNCISLFAFLYILAWINLSDFSALVKVILFSLILSCVDLRVFGVPLPWRSVMWFNCFFMCASNEETLVVTLVILFYNQSL